MLKRISILLAISTILLSCFCMGIQAEKMDAHPDTIPRWISITSMQGGISFSEDTGTYTMKINGINDVSKIEATATLYYINSRGNRSKITTWNYIKEDYKLTIDEDFTAVSGREYVVDLEGTAYIGSSGEDFDNTVFNTCP